MPRPLSRRRDRDPHRRGADPPLRLRGRAKRAKQLAEALQGLGIKLGDRVGTLAWNTYRHFELYFGISGIGAVLHTINPRLAPEHVAYIANHAEDQAIFVDLNLLPMVEGVFAELKTVKHVVVMTDRAHMPASPRSPTCCATRS